MKILLVLMEGGSELLNILKPVAISLLTVVCAITSMQMCFCLPSLQLVKSCLHAASFPV